MTARFASLRLFVANSLLASRVVPIGLRRRLYRALGLRIDGTVSFGMYCRLGIEIGRGTYVNANCFFDGNVRIGLNCLVGMGAMFVTSTHDILGPGRYGAPRGEPIVVGDRCWIGAGATVLPGVKIGDEIVVAAGAVVSNSLYEPGIYGGIPARRIADLPTGD